MRRGPRPGGFFRRGQVSREIQWQSFDILLSKYAQVTWCAHGSLVCAVAKVTVYDREYCAIAHGDGREFFADTAASTFGPGDFPDAKDAVEVAVAVAFHALELRSRILARAMLDDDDDGDPDADATRLATEPSRRKAWSAKQYKARVSKAIR